jgi:hypothetical protein
LNRKKEQAISWLVSSVHRVLTSYGSITTHLSSDGGNEMNIGLIELWEKATGESTAS